MGVFSCQIRVASLDGVRNADMEALVDTGAEHTFVLGNLLQALGIRPIYRSLFEFADGRRAEMDVGLARITVGALTETVPVVFAEGDAAPLLGADTLQAMKLVVDMGFHEVRPSEDQRG